MVSLSYTVRFLPSDSGPPRAESHAVPGLGSRPSQSRDHRNAPGCTALSAPAIAASDATYDLSGLIGALDVPSELDGSTGETPGASVPPDRPLTLARPMTDFDAVEGGAFLDDVLNRSTVADRLAIRYRNPISDREPDRT